MNPAQIATGDCSVPPAQRPGRKALIREAVLEDYGQIARIQHQAGLNVRPRGEWTDLIAGNPVRRKLDPECPMGWVLETPSGEIVGSIASIPRICRIGGRRLRSVAIADWVVSELYRGYSVPLLGRALTQRNVDFFVSTTVSPAAEAVLRFLKFSPVPAGNWDKAHFWITGHYNVVKAMLQSKRLPAAGLVAHPLAAVMSCADSLRSFGASNHIRGVDVEVCSSFDQRFEDFWNELQVQMPHMLLVERSRASLEWHFRSSLERNQIWILALKSGARMIAYAIFDRMDNLQHKLKRVRLADFCALEQAGEALELALTWMLKECRRSGLHLLETVGWLDRPELTRSRAPYQRKLESFRYYYKACEPDLEKFLMDSAVWSPSAYDGDPSL